MSLNKIAKYAVRKWCHKQVKL